MLFKLLAATVVVVVANAAYTDFTCPTGWTLAPFDDTCNAVWPRRAVNGSAINATYAFDMSMKMNFQLAQEFCAAQGATLPQIRDLTTQLPFYKTMMGTTSGRGYWLNVWSDPTTTITGPTTSTWVTTDLRPSGFVFDWDTAPAMPRSYDRCAFMGMRGNGASKTVHGYNEKMYGSDCNSDQHALCTKPRIPLTINAINEGEPRRIEFVYKTSTLELRFYGPRIPTGTLVTLQSSSATSPSSEAAHGQPTHCKNIKDVTGVSAPFTLTVATEQVGTNVTFNNEYCGSGTCDVGTITIPSTHPFVLGASYSLCFFVASPFATPSVLSEYEHELLGGDMVIDVVTKYDTYLENVCERRKQTIESIVNPNANGFADTSRTDLRVNGQFPFTSRVEDSLDSINKFEQPGEGLAV
jgi:hypothetical protein